MIKRMKILFMTMERRNKAFTLIELLAVIVILSIIAIISTPIVLNIINKSKKSAFLDTAYGIIESARLYYTEQILEEKIPTNKEFKFDSENELKYNGTKPKGGSLILTDKGEVILAIHNNVWCASKARNESKVSLKKYEESTCVIPDDIEIPEEPNCPTVEIMGKNIETCETMTNDPDHNLRYVGKNPKNFVLFNNELWRIIGIFNGQAKIIRNEFYSEDILWDDDLNDWSQASLQTELNGTYLSSIREASKAMIDETHVWKLGGSIARRAEMHREKMYNNERGTNVYGSNSTEWTGAIGLMHASDYGYSTSSLSSECDSMSMYTWRDTSETTADCVENTWLYKPSYAQWTITSASDYKLVFDVSDNGSVYYPSLVNSMSVRPALYLKSNIKIIDGEGSSTNPFILSI